MVAGVVVLRALFGRRIPLSLGTPVVAAVLLTILVVPGVWGAMRGLDFVRDDLRLAPGINEREKCLVDAHQDWAVNFSRWLTERMPPDSRFALSGSVPRVCLQLGLLPRLMVGFDEPRDFSVYVGDLPAEVRARLRAERRLPATERTVERYAKLAAIVEER